MDINTLKILLKRHLKKWNNLQDNNKNCEKSEDTLFNIIQDLTNWGMEEKDIKKLMENTPPKRKNYLIKNYMNGVDNIHYDAEKEGEYNINL